MAAIRVTEVQPEEREKFRVPGTTDKYYTYKTDRTTLKSFGKQGFMDALEYIGVISSGENAS